MTQLRDISISAPQKTGRAYSIDILRGLAILLMVLSSLEPFGSLPAWMYHAQTPPPTHAFNPEVAGITWVDLVFPFFIFTMGAAMPFAMTRRLESGMSIIAAVWAIIKRYFLLIAFAIYAFHANPSTLSSQPDAKVWLGAIFFFFLMFAIWGRFPFKISSQVKVILKVVGVVIACVAFSMIEFNGGRGFSVFRTNIILYVLADLALFGSIVWLFTRNNLLLRLGILAVIAVVRLSYIEGANWIESLGNHYSIPCLANYMKAHVSHENLHYCRWVYDFSWLVQWRFLKYLFIIIPATIAGDMIYKYAVNQTQQEGRWSKSRYLVIVLSMFAIVLVALTGLYSRHILTATLITAGLAVVSFCLFAKPLSDMEILLSRLFKWASFWLLLGYLAEPYEGGIKKDSSTFSYYFITVGLAICFIILLKILIKVFNLKNVFSLLIYSGQNPMVAYLTSSNVLIPMLALVGLRDDLFAFYAKSSWGGFVLACGLVILVAFFVSIFSRFKVYLRT